MLRVMIIDDDFNVRKCLRALIPWADIGCELVAEASDGAEGLAQFQSVQPNMAKWIPIECSGFHAAWPN